MRIKEIESPINRTGRNTLNDNFKNLDRDLSFSLANSNTALNNANEAKQNAEESNTRSMAVEERLNDIIIDAGQSDAEVVASRTDAITGENFNSLPTRLDAQNNSVITRLNNLDKRIKHVTYEMFGAVLNGIADDTAAIRRCHEYANENNLSVIQEKGIIRISDTIEVQTSTNLNGCQLITGSFNEGKVLYKITSKNPEIDVTSEVNKSQLSRGSVRVASLSQYKNHLVYLFSQQIAFNRINGNTEQAISRNEVDILGRNGFLLGGGLLQDYSTATDQQLSVRVKLYDNEKLVFKCPELRWEFGNFASTLTAYAIERSNVDFNDFYISIPNDADINDTGFTSFKGQVITIDRCCNVNIDNAKGENITVGQNASAYILNISNVVNLTIKNSVMVAGWGVISSLGVKNFNVYDSQINRVDSHANSGNIYCRNVNFTGGWGLSLGYGRGKVVLDNCLSDFRYQSLDGRNLSSIVTIGTSYGLVYEGEINILNHKIASNGSGNKNIVNLAYAAEIEGRDFRIPYNLRLPSVYVDGLYFENSSGERLLGYRTNNVPLVKQTLINNSISLQMPYFITFKNINFRIFDNNSYFTSFIYDNIDTSMRPYVAYGSTDITVENIPQTVHSGFKNGFTSAELIDPYVNPIIDVRDIVINAGTQGYKFRMKNSGGSIRLNTKSKLVDIRDSEISAASFSNDNTYFADDVQIHNSKVYGRATTAATFVVIDTESLTATGSIFYSVRRGGVLLTYTLSNRVNPPRFLLNNALGSNTATPAQDEMFALTITR